MEKTVGRKKSDVWDHVEILNDVQVRCKHCNFVFARNAHRIKIHIGEIKGNGVRLCSKFSSETDKTGAKSRNFQGAGSRSDYSEALTETTKEETCNQIGPFHASHNKYKESDLQLIRYVFDPSQAREETVIRFDHYHLKRSEFATLGPEACLSSAVIDTVAEHYTQMEKEKKKNAATINWFLPSLFWDSAQCCDANFFVDFIERQKIIDFMPLQLANCDKMFIPAYVGNSNSCGHFFLYVVDIKENVVEIWDSIPSFVSEIERNEKTQKLLIAMDILFDDAKRENWAFANFSVKMAENAPKQPNDHDCGIFVTKFIKDSVNAMQNKPFESHEERLDLALDLLKSEQNKERETLFRKAALWHGRLDKKDQPLVDETNIDDISIFNQNMRNVVKSSQGIHSAQPRF